MDTLDGGAGNDTLDGGAGSDTFLFGFGDGRDTAAGGRGGGWTDAIDLQGVAGGPGDGDWTIALSRGRIVAETDHQVTLSADSAGTITLSDGSELTFNGVERVTF